VTRTPDPIITNNRASRQTAVFPPMSATIYPIWAAFVRFLSRDVVHWYIGPERCGKQHPGPDHNAKEPHNG
jgi:hypothetical protein